MPQLDFLRRGAFPRGDSISGGIGLGTKDSTKFNIEQTLQAST